MLKRIRVAVSIISIILMTLLFVDFTGWAHTWLGWMAKIQFLPAVLALNFGVIIGLVVLTLLFGRVYCSVICPLGIMQDIFGYFGKKTKKNRYSYSPAKNILRYVMLVLMVLAIIFGISAFVVLLAPYSAYGRIAQTILQPIVLLVNNFCAYIAEKVDSYVFYSVDVWIRSGITLGVAIVTLVVLGFLAWRNGRTYCNTICPVGTLLGLLSRFSLFRMVIGHSKCVKCGLCARNCKGSCINSKDGKIDYSRCVVCFDCIGKCSTGAISYTWRRKGTDSHDKGENKKPSESKSKSAPEKEVDASRRGFMAVAGTMVAAAAVQAKEKTVDGGFAVIEDKQKPVRKTRIVPPGAKSLDNLADHCTACQLCVSECPNNVLRPSSDLSTLMQPESSYERGYCRPECTRCSEVCPTGAICKITKEEKSSIQIGRAVWIKDNCIVKTEGVSCGLCSRSCPAGVITMIPINPQDENSLKIPAVNTERCIGCGSCEYHCPARPFSAIYVEGNERHRLI